MDPAVKALVQEARELGVTFWLVPQAPTLIVGESLHFCGSGSTSERCGEDDASFVRLTHSSCKLSGAGTVSPPVFVQDPEQSGNCKWNLWE